MAVVMVVIWGGAGTPKLESGPTDRQANKPQRDGWLAGWLLSQTRLLKDGGSQGRIDVALRAAAGVLALVSVLVDLHLIFFWSRPGGVVGW